MELEDYEFVSGDRIYEIYDGIIEVAHSNKPLNVEYLGAISQEKADSIQRSYVYFTNRSHKEIWFEDEIDLGELEQEVQTGMVLVGKPINKPYTLWMSPAVEVQ